MYRWNPQTPSPMPFHRYRPHHERVAAPPVRERGWPGRRITEAPLWVPVDLRDGNQALAEPMDAARKRRFFELLVRTGFKEIEVGYPSASRTDFDFVRQLVTSGAVPDDVTPVVFTPAKPDLIERTFASIEGLPRAVVHLYVATSPVWRDVVLGRTRAEILALVREAGTRMARLAHARGDAHIRFQFAPETFNLTEPDFALELCDGLTELWDASPDRPVTHNLPTTVETATPDVYADQIEYMHRNLARRDSVILSVHPHNDRGTGVACAELALLAGAQRVEGCLFGNGERTGNVDLVTLALNLYTQGVDPKLDLSGIDAVRETVEHCNQLPVHPRHPYAGDLVHTAFSGTHQDAISKGFAHRAADPDGPWEVPYLPVDPADLGRSYEAVIRINSQSGKGGMAYLLREHHGIDLPREMRPEYARAVQEATDASGREAGPDELYALFRDGYLDAGGPVRLVDWAARRDGAEVHHFACTVEVDGERRELEGKGNGPLAAFGDALRAAGVDADIESFAQHALGAGSGGEAVAYARCRVGRARAWGAARHTSVLAASVGAVLSAVNRAAATEG
ncbi:MULTISPECIES: 2-isopropylmalate synthase [unclassified Streptomyces]|uniref:2-isopropylmalate synthase n=1 Tax=unclassified Streptomyces TaxID=2593676 RepID=UPI000DB9611F|nr:MULTISPECIES: 2-isopropylmalate synthase [unclassified Streptomyces]MYT69540.1 2-isopropylmalate synthase [Streptomyces sp. SID8367]RAJ74089.1 2-isopropylmalate synthase [Streptomyces sp. PsTaAH-137]